MGNSKYLRGDLVYQKEHDRCQCPAGKYLTPTPATILLTQTGADGAVSWTKPDELEVDAEAPLAGLGTIPPTGFYVVMTNARVFHF